MFYDLFKKSQFVVKNRNIEKKELFHIKAIMALFLCN